MECLFVQFVGLLLDVVRCCGGIMIDAYTSVPSVIEMSLLLTRLTRLDEARQPVPYRISTALTLFVSF